MHKTQCAGASGQGDGNVLTINHKLMKVKLHTTAPKPATYRVHLSHDGELEVARRAYGGTWNELGASGLKDPLRTIIHHFLRNRNDHRHYFLFDDEVSVLLNRCDGRPPIDH